MFRPMSPVANRRLSQLVIRRRVHRLYPRVSLRNNPVQSQVLSQLMNHLQNLQVNQAVNPQDLQFHLHRRTLVTRTDQREIRPYGPQFNRQEILLEFQAALQLCLQPVFQPESPIL
jgi:hypothetical protein